MLAHRHTHSIYTSIWTAQSAVQWNRMRELCIQTRLTEQNNYTHPYIRTHTSRWQSTTKHIYIQIDTMVYCVYGAERVFVSNSIWFVERYGIYWRTLPCEIQILLSSIRFGVVFLLPLSSSSPFNFEHVSLDSVLKLWTLCMLRFFAFKKHLKNKLYT